MVTVLRVHMLYLHRELVSERYVSSAAEEGKTSGGREERE